MANPVLFRRFKNLPSEIQCKVWDNTFEPRMITLINYNTRPRHNEHGFEAILLVDRDARAYFLSKYKACFKSGSLRCVYINFKIDTLCLATGFPCLRLMLRRHLDDFQGLERLQLMPNYDNIWYRDPQIEDYTPLGTIATLKHVTLRSFDRVLARRPSRRPRYVMEYDTKDIVVSAMALRFVLGLVEKRKNGEETPTMALMFKLSDLRIKTLSFNGELLFVWKRGGEVTETTWKIFRSIEEMHEEHYIVWEVK